MAKGPRNQKTVVSNKNCFLLTKSDRVLSFFAPTTSISVKHSVELPKASQLDSFQPAFLLQCASKCALQVSLVNKV